MAVLGLVRFGARDFDPYTGRWTARDPILFAGEQANLYAYAGNDPVNFLDPTGLLVDAVYSISRGELSIVDMTTGVNIVIAAHSGDRPFPGDATLGPIPVGRYEILRANPNRNGSVYRLESRDGTRNDFDKFSGRSRFRMHRGTFTNGCINVTSDDSWKAASSIIDNTASRTVPDFFQGNRPFGLSNADGEPITLFGYLRVIQ
jgi:hypothetical protein